MDEEIVNILSSYGCKYMADDYKEMIEEIVNFVKKREETINYAHSCTKLPIKEAEEFFDKGGDWRISCKNLTDGVITKLQWSETEDFEEVYERLNK